MTMLSLLDRNNFKHIKEILIRTRLKIRKNSLLEIMEKNYASFSIKYKARLMTLFLLLEKDVMNFQFCSTHFCPLE